MNEKMNDCIIVVRQVENGMVVEVSADAQTALNAVAMVIATAVWNMAAAGTAEKPIRQQMNICMDQGIREGLKKAREEKTHE